MIEALRRKRADALSQTTPGRICLQRGGRGTSRRMVIIDHLTKKLSAQGRLGIVLTVWNAGYRLGRAGSCRSIVGNIKSSIAERI